MPVDYFTVRSRALASFLTAILGALANLCTGALLDLPFSQRTKSKAIYLVTATAITASWIWNAVIQAELSTLISAPSAFDIGQTGSAASAFAVYMSRLSFLDFPHSIAPATAPATGWKSSKHWQILYCNNRQSANTLQCSVSGTRFCKRTSTGLWAKSATRAHKQTAGSRVPRESYGPGRVLGVRSHMQLVRAECQT